MPTSESSSGEFVLSRRGLLRGSAAVTTTAALAVGGVFAATRNAAAVQTASDFYHPFTGYPVTGTWQDHIGRGSLGGIDFGMGVGTGLPACGGGVVTNIPENGTGGHTVTIAHDNGYRTQYMHLSQFVLDNGTRVAAGAIVGLSGGEPGAPGSGESTGPHLHWHMINPNGTRINPVEYVGGGGGKLPKTGTEQDGVPGVIFWQRAQKWLSLEAGYTGPVDGAPGKGTYSALQRALRDGWGYTGPIDGVPGAATYSALQRLAAEHGYTGPIDGAMGANSWRGVARFLNQDRWD
ncbi:M23 family metallopeptidase [Streptomyces sp. XM4193]|uniref:M23 family metallopeptidase n=1 Tax=Streptomyces sp. XM4193 TaxID=2929782 RepID=UPI001FFB931F|nr:M23 family metallopeptidase [Streptomyces sp. XM4193]MCK1797888.1 M23 family metallopeptidase [Streptomyces sp. XM4193]